MEMELNLVLNETNFKFFVKISRLDERFHKNKNKLRQDERFLLKSRTGRHKLKPSC
jgi:hypothetical protein